MNTQKNRTAGQSGEIQAITDRLLITGKTFHRWGRALWVAIMVNGKAELQIAEGHFHQETIETEIEAYAAPRGKQ